MTSLGVIGNISIDTAHYPSGTQHELLGGAALHHALAAGRAGLTARPISVIGDDLGGIRTDPRLGSIDFSQVLSVPGPSCRFTLTYDSEGNVAKVESDYGVAHSLTQHAITVLASWDFDHWHVACRRPLDVERVLTRLIADGRPFSVDFHLASATEQIQAAQHALPRAAVVFLNAGEHDLLRRHVPPETLPAVVVSDGTGEATLFRRGESVASAVPPQVTALEVTGAGDTLAGTFLACALRGVSDDRALTTAVAAASRHVALPGLRHRLQT